MPRHRQQGQMLERKIRQRKAATGVAAMFPSNEEPKKFSGGMTGQSLHHNRRRVRKVVKREAHSITAKLLQMILAESHTAHT